MSASITLAGVSWATPDHRPILENIDLSLGAERTGLVGRNGTGKTTLLRLIAGEVAPHAGSVAVNGRLSVLRQAVQVSATETVADLFGVSEALAVLERAAQGTATAEQIENADWTLEARMTSALGRVHLDAEPSARLSALSGGQRTRAALAALVFAQPDFLLLDEPTNNLDRQGREAVTALLSTWRAGALVVSHDRDLLETMDAIVELTSLGASRYGGNWSHYRAMKALELEAAEQDAASAEKRVAETARSAQAAAERQARRDSAGRRAALKGGMPKILLGARKERAEATGGAGARLAERQRARAEAAAATARARVEARQPLSISLPSTGLPAGRTVLRIEKVTAGYDGNPPVLADVSLDITGPERVALTGPNGSGKTTLLAVIAGTLVPWQGEARVLSDFAMLDQQLSVLDRSTSIRDNFRRLHPQTGENACRLALARFMFRADAALQTVSTLSGGQLLRAGLACVLGGTTPPPLLILDEPTNHLDIDSIESVEAGLRGYDGALLIVSHDDAFLGHMGITRRVELAGTRRH